MFLRLLSSRQLTAVARRNRTAPSKHRSLRPTLEVLEGRSLPSSLTLASVASATDIHGDAHTVLMGNKHGNPSGPGDPPTGGL